MGISEWMQGMFSAESEPENDKDIKERFENFQKFMSDGWSGYDSLDALADAFDTFDGMPLAGVAGLPRFADRDMAFYRDIKDRVGNLTSSMVRAEEVGRMIRDYKQALVVGQKDFAEKLLYRLPVTADDITRSGDFDLQRTVQQLGKNIKKL